MITPQQIKAIRAALARKGLINVKDDIIYGASGGKTTSMRELSKDEARQLLMVLNSDKPEKTNALMIRKMMAQAFEMRWIKKIAKVKSNGELEEGNDYTVLYNWVLKYGYLKKDLREYTYEELPKLVSQFEKVYSEFIKKL